MTPRVLTDEYAVHLARAGAAFDLLVAESPGDPVARRAEWTAALDVPLPRHGAGADVVVDQLVEVLVPNGVRLVEPGFWGWITSGATTVPTIAALTASVAGGQRYGVTAFCPTSLACAPEFANELRQLATHEMARGVYPTRLTRGAIGLQIPVLPETKLNRGDILRISGTLANTDRAIAALGYADRPTDVTDMVWVGLGILVGGLIGAIEFQLGPVPITLSTSGGALLAGLFIGWLRSVSPAFGRVPTPSQWFMNSVGLTMFIAVVGISSGPTFFSGLREAGITLFFWGLFATTVPMLLAPLIGKYVFKFDPAINLGCCGGARTSTASAGMVADAAQSNVPMLGYTVPYAVSNTLLTIWGMVVVLLIS